MKLYAISDLHIGHPANAQALTEMPAHPDDWLILAGDIGETTGHLDTAFRLLKQRFAQLIWVPGNHELWTLPQRETTRGAAKYSALVDVCKRHGVLSPEDPYAIWPHPDHPHLIAPLFLLYDYSFCPDGMSPSQAVDWAKEHGLVCTDEEVLFSDPYPSRVAWCHARVKLTETRLTRAVAEHRLPTVLINHFPLRRDQAILPRIPRFSIWCGTRKTEDWHLRFGASAVVYGHLHIRQRSVLDGVRFCEVSLGYPRQWSPERGIGAYLQEILPGDRYA